MASILILFTRSEVWLALLLGGFSLALLAWRLHLRWWPAFLLRFCLLVMTLTALFAALWGIFTPQTAIKRQVMVVDLSDSVAAKTRQQTLEQALQWQAEDSSGAGVPVTGLANERGRPEEQKNRSVVVFGSAAYPILQQKGAVDSQASGLPAVDGRASSFAEAIQLADNLLGKSPGQILLASDGLAAQPEVVGQVVAGLPGRGHTLDVIPLAPRPSQNDLALGSLIAPKHLWAGTPVGLLVPVIGAEPGVPVRIQLKINGQASPLNAQPAAQSLTSANASGLYHFQIPALPEGMVTLGVTVSVDDAERADPFPGNNAAFTVLQVFAPPRVLFVTSQKDTEAVNRFSQAMSKQKIQMDIAAPEKFTTNLEALQQYRVIFVDNLLANQLTHEQMTALQVFVSKLAGGVIFLGGRNSYTLGGYQGTPLEAMLPVKLQPPPRTQRPPIVFQLILDRSSSMGVGEQDVAPIALARESAMRAIETLQGEDYLGLLTFSDDPNWDIPLRPLGGSAGLQQALDAVGQVDAEGSTNMYKAMQETIQQMMALPANAPQSRHILLLSDGQSTDGSSSAFEELAKAAHNRGITISTIALGAGADEEVMQKIAEAGKGRFYSVKDAKDLPRILISESKAARSENIQSGETSLKSVEAGHPVLSGINPDQMPLLSGYNALQSKVEEGAEDILVSTSFGDPVLSAWQYGLGRVAAWTSDLGEEWTANWQPDSEGIFWAQVVRYMLVDPAQSSAQANVQVEPTRLLVDAAIYTPDGGPLNLAEVKFTYADPGGKSTTYRMVQKSAGTYQAEIPRPPEGAYRAVLSYLGEDGKMVEVPAPFAVNPPPEWLPQSPAAGAANLQTWASAAGGQATNMQAILDSEKPDRQQQAAFLADPWNRLLLALVLFWLLEIAARRRWLPWMM